jgi:hypothetical protein
MARTVLHGSSRQQHHNVNAAVLQPSGDPDGVRRHAIPVKVFHDSNFIRLLYNVARLLFGTLSTVLLFGGKDFLLLLVLSLVVAHSMIPTFAREHRTYFFWEGKVRLGWVGWDSALGMFSMVRTI